jgi:hypothetical protein
MNKILDLAISKAAKLSPEAQEQLGRELLERIDTLESLRSQIDLGIAELDTGLGQALDINAVIKQARAEHGRNE